MTFVSRIYSSLIDAMAVIAGATLVWLMVSVVVSVLMRNLGLQPFAWLFTSSEYGLLYMTMLGAPWLVREKGHVHIELVTSALPEGSRRVVSRLVAFTCVLVCVILAWKGLELFLKNIERGDYDTRAYSRIYSTITPEMVAQEQDREASISSISARANMLTEFVEFLENSFPEMINSLIGLVGTFFIIYFLNFQVFIACLIATVVIILLYALTSDRIYRYNQGFNDSLEHQVAVLTENDPPSIKKHFQGLMRWNIRLSDLETINFSVSWVFLFGVLIFSIIAVVENGAPSQGKVLAVLMYVFNYIESVIAIPLFYQQYVRLKEISHRLE